MRTRYTHLLAMFALAPLALASCSPKAAKPVAILAVNDMHATIDNMPRLAYIADSLRAIYPELILVAAGDNQTGNPINDQHPQKGLPMIELMNATGFDLSAVGNHEFDTGKEGFAYLTQQASFPFVCTSFQPSDSSYRIAPYIIRKLGDGTRVAFASILALNAQGIPDSHPSNVEGFQFFTPEQVQPTVLQLRDSADILVLINHYGFEDDVELTKEYAEGAVDLIIGGHSHTLVEDEQVHNGILITQAQRRLTHATLITMQRNGEGKLERKMQLLTVGPNGEKSPKVLALVDSLNSRSPLKAKIAEAEDDFSSIEQLGYLATDAMRAITGTQVALINHGGIRIDGLPKGPVSANDIYTLDPFGNEAIGYTLTGKELHDLVVAGWHADEYRFVYPSGLRIRYSIGPNDSLRSVELLHMNGKPVGAKERFTVSINSYMATAFKYEHADAGTSMQKATADCTIEYLRNLGTIPSYRDEKRIEVNK